MLLFFSETQTRNIASSAMRPTTAEVQKTAGEDEPASSLSISRPTIALQQRLLRLSLWYRWRHTYGEPVSCRAMVCGGRHGKAWMHDNRSMAGTIGCRHSRTYQKIESSEGPSPPLIQVRLHRHLPNIIIIVSNNCCNNNENNSNIILVIIISGILPGYLCT